MISQPDLTATSPISTTAPGRPLILFTHEYEPFHGGVATYCAELAHSIHLLGYPIEIWAPDYSQAHPASISGPSVRRLHSPGNLKPAGLYSMAREIWRRKEQLRGSILFLPSVGAQMVIIVLSLFPSWPRIPTAVLWHGSEILRFQRNPFWRIFATRFFKRADFVFVASPFVRMLARRSPLVPLEKSITLIPCAPGSDAFLQAEPSPPDSHGRIRILTLARLHPRKGQLHTIRALAGLPLSLKEKIVYQVAGTGKPRYLKKLRRNCARAGVSFEYMGTVPGSRLSTVYAQCDIYAMTSQSLSSSVEGFGITYLEAGLQSKPVIACRSGGVEGAVIDGKTGLLVEENDLAGLTAALASLISDANLRQKLGKGNFQYASEFSWEHSARLFLEQISGPAAGNADKKR